MRLPRASGVLLHPTSLPGPEGSGDLGASAYQFVDWLHAAGQSLWQMLPLGGIGPGDSPYMSSSAFAGNLLLIDLANLQQQGWLTAQRLSHRPASDPHCINFATLVPWRMGCLATAASAFAAQASPAEQQDFEAFCSEQSDWLPNYALFMALCEVNDWADWPAWAPALAQRDPAALRAARQQQAPRIAFFEFCQWRFFRQWAALRAYAHAKGVRIVGDAPIFIAHQSAEVWARPDLFELSSDGWPSVVAGVPPDYFSVTGQRWGNPLYRWPAHAADGYAWWVQRLRKTFELVDIVRIDHFRGFADYWEIPASEPTAIQGRWQPGPGMALFNAVSLALGPLPVIAEDLGELSSAAKALLHASGFPGMTILQFAFGGDANNAYLPHNHVPHSVAYTGTHDNDTSLGWWGHSASDRQRHHARAYLGSDGHDIAWAMLRAECASVADTVVHPMQDILVLPGNCRMNLPGGASGWWRWRFDWRQVHAWHGQRLAEMTRLFGRAPDGG